MTALGNVPGRPSDDLGRQLTATTASDGGARSVGQTLVYNALGQVATATDAAGNVTAFAYDYAGRRTAVTNALGQVTSTHYDALGNVTNVTGATYPVSYGYDDWNRMVWMKTYRDENGAGDLTQWHYDDATGLVTNKVYADGKGTAYTYTADGKLARRTWARGVTTDYGYTAAGELETVNYSDATPDVTYTHDRLGRPVTIADGTGTRTNVYDVATLALAQEKLANGLTLTRSQDVLGRSSGISMPDYSVEYGYDNYGRFGSVTSSVTSVVNYSYLPGSDLLAGYTQGNLTRAVAYEANRDLMDTVENKYGATTVSKFDYTNDDLGRRTNREDTGTAFAAAWTNNFGYNLRSEVTGAGMRNGNSSYTYDPIGNRTTVALPEEQNPLVYAANPLNQYTAITGRTAPAYDFDGNMTDDGAGLGLAWDGENRLIQTVQNGQTVTYAYDFMSRRVSKTVGGTTHGYLYDGWNLISETDGTTVKRYVWGLDLSQTLQGAGGVGGLLCCSSGAQPPEIFAPTYDANGNISEYIALATGAIASHREYDAFGRVILTTGTAPSAFGFSTKYTDAETGLVYYGYRYYSAELGRWLNRDPVGEYGGRNIYAICNNDVSLCDYLGLKWIIGSREKTKLRVTACSDGDPNDSWTKLAEEVGLNAEEAPKWVTGYTESPIPGYNYEIPNTIMAIWIGNRRDTITTNIGHQIASLKSRGFMVLLFSANCAFSLCGDSPRISSEEYVYLMNALLISRSLQGIFVEGHGDPGHIYDSSHEGWVLGYDEIESVLKRTYHLGAVILNVCQGGWSARENPTDVNSKYIIDPAWWIHFQLFGPRRVPGLVSTIKAGGKDLASKNAVFYGLRSALNPFTENADIEKLYADSKHHTK